MGSAACVNQLFRTGNRQLREKERITCQQLFLGAHVCFVENASSDTTYQMTSLATMIGKGFGSPVPTQVGEPTCQDVDA